MDVCIKNIDEENWRLFKEESAKHALKLGDLFNCLLREHTNKCKGTNWDRVLYGEKKLKGLLTREEGDKIRSEFRKGFSLRL